MDSSLTDFSLLQRDGGVKLGRQGASLCGTRQVHSVSQCAALSGTALLPVPSAALPVSPTLMYKPATFPLSRPWRARQKLPDLKWQRPFFPVLPFSAARACSPTRWKKCFEIQDCQCHSTAAGTLFIPHRRQREVKQYGWYCGSS